MERRLAAILAADVAGYSRLVGTQEETTIRRWNACREVIGGLVAEHRGRVFGGAGDSLVAEFASPVEAVRCAVRIQRRLADDNAELSEEQRLRLRIGVNLGDVVVEREDLLGDGVNIAARLEGLAEPGGVCVSGAVFDQVKGKGELRFVDLGERRVKNIAEPLRVYSIDLAAGPHAAAPQAAASAARDPARADSAEADLLDIDLSLPDRPSIAVLPFVNMSADPEQEHFSDGIAEDIITALSKIGSLLVVARNSSFAYKGQAVDVKRIGREQGVRYVLEGSVRKAGKRVRVTAQLVDAQAGHHLWAERYDRDLEDIFAVQDEIMREVVTALDVHLREGEQARFWSSGTRNVAAWECVRIGGELANRLNPADRLEARRLVKQALELDPGYGSAWIALGWTHFHDADASTQYGAAVPREEALAAAVACARKAFEIDPASVDAYALLAMCHLSSGEYDEAVAKSQKALALAPNLAEKLAIAAHVLIRSGQPQRAFAPIRKAMRLCPIYPAWYLHILGSAYRAVGKTEAAVAVFRAAIRRTPDHLALHVGLASALGELGREAGESVAEVLKRSPDFSIARYAAGLSYRDPAELRRFAEGLQRAGLPA